MNDPLTAFLAAELAAPVPAPLRAWAAELAAAAGARAALFYGSILRTGNLDGVADFYLLTDAPLPGLWPRVSYHERIDAGRTLRAKVATMDLATFTAAARGERRDTTIWTRFVQPAALAFAADDTVTPQVTAALADAAATAARFAAALGPVTGSPADYWRALFRATYSAEFRVEAAGREAQILAYDPQRWAALLPLGWARAGIGFTGDDRRLTPVLLDRAAILRRWRRARRWGKPLNVARLVQAAFTFEGAGRYAAWKIERHTGVAVPLSAWQERHPILAAPGVLWRVFRTRA